MTDALERFIDPEFVYSFWQGPQEVRSEEDARLRGLNCVALAHLCLESLFGYQLPPEQHCYEMFVNTSHFATLSQASAVRRGDVFWFGPSSTDVAGFTPQYNGYGLLLNWRASPVRHMAIATGDTQDGQPLLLHATHIEGTNVVWPVAKFADYVRYERVHRRARLAIG